MSTASRPVSAAGATARGLLRRAFKATLSTLVPDSGHPYGSLVAIATEPDGAPLLLLSGLAVHTKNAAADQRASLLIDGTAAGRAALTGARVCLVGALAPTRSATARPRYLARHPDAERFIDFGDFGLYTLDVQWAHMVAGFGRIERLSRADIILDTSDAGDLIAAEPDILAHMNTDHADTLPLMAAAFGEWDGEPPSQNGGNPEPWSMIGCDPEGLDLVHGDRAARVGFPQRVMGPGEARAALVDLVARARRTPE
jgi:putative heme iron utilization protein